jgi:colanic acid/amylovoran biosynthesis glycosyltransferase
MSNDIRIAYIASCYPCVSHTFITREIEALRNRGIFVDTYSMNQPNGPFAEGSDEAEHLRTTEILRIKLIIKFIIIAIRNMGIFIQWLPGAIKLIMEGNSKLHKKLGYIMEAMIMAKCLKDNKIQHIHVHFVNPAADVALVASRALKISWSISIHGPDSMEDLSKFDFIRRVKSADCIRVISKYAKQQVLRHVGHDVAQKISVIHCGVEINENITRNDRSTKNYSGLTVGRLVSAKGQIYLLEALEKLKNESGYEPKWVFIGTGPDEKYLKKKSRDLGLEEQVSFLGARDRRDVEENLEKCDLFVLPSLAEGIPVSLMEAMAKEVPVISCTTNGIPELIHDGINGILCEPTSVKQLHDALYQSISKNYSNEAMIYMAKKTIMNEYNSKTTGVQMMDLFMNILGVKINEIKQIELEVAA